MPHEHRGPTDVTKTLRHTSPRSTTSASRSPTGELVALLGPPARGKTTLLRIIAGLEVPDARHHPLSRRGRHRPARPGAPGRIRLSALRAVPPHDACSRMSPSVCGSGPERSGPPDGEIRETVHGAAQAGPARLAGRPLSVAALRRPAAARRPGPGAGGRAPGAAAGRAVRRARRQGAQGTAPLAAPAARRNPRHQRLRHPRSGRGAGGGRSRGGDERRPDRADRHARGGLRATRRLRSSTASSAT